MAYQAQVPLLLAQGYRPELLIQGLPVMAVGDWRSPPAWRPKYMWTGDVKDFTPTPKEVVEARKADRKIPTRKGWLLPRLILAQNATQEALLVRQGATQAVLMPAEQKDQILDYYAPEELTPDMRAICAERIAAREAERLAAPTRKAAPKPAARKGRKAS